MLGEIFNTIINAFFYRNDDEKLNKKASLGQWTLESNKKLYCRETAWC